MKVIKVPNYKAFGEMLHEKTGYDINIKLIDGAKHVHYQFETDGISLGILCVDNGEVSFAPFVTHEDYSRTDQFINIKYMPMFDELIKLFKVFNELFVYDYEEDFKV